MVKRSILLASLLLVAGCGGSARPAEGPSGGSLKSGDPSTGNSTTRSFETDNPEAKKETEASAGDKMQRAQGGLGPADDADLKKGQALAGEGGKGAPEKPAPGPGGVRAAVVDSSTPLGNGRLTQAQIAQILEKGGDVFGDCYNLGAGGANKDFRATITVKATIGPSGKVNAVEVQKSTANNPKVDACVAQAFKKVKFPAPADGATSVITFPITFNGLEVVK